MCNLSASDGAGDLVVSGGKRCGSEIREVEHDDGKPGDSTASSSVAHGAEECFGPRCTKRRREAMR